MFAVFIFIFLVVVAFLYITRPRFLIVEVNQVSSAGSVEEIDMWKAFIIALLIATAVCIIYGYLEVRHLL